MILKLVQHDSDPVRQFRSRRPFDDFLLWVVSLKYLDVLIELVILPADRNVTLGFHFLALDALLVVPREHASHVDVRYLVLHLGLLGVD